MKRVALIEDNPDNRLLVGALLEEHYEISEFADGADALASMPQQQPDAILLDISLPEMDGIEVLRRVRADESLADLPVIALTAHAMIGDRERCIEAGCSGYMTKPVKREALVRYCLEQLASPAD